MPRRSVRRRDEHGRWASGRSGNPNGRPRGTPNATTASVKQALLNAFVEAGGEKFLLKLAKSDPKTFVMLLAKLIPREIQARVQGPPDMAERILEARKRARLVAAERNEEQPSHAETDD